MHTNVHGNIIHNSQRSENPSVQMINKTWYTHTMEHSVIKRKEVLLNVTIWKNLENIMLSEIRRTQKDKYMIPFTWDTKDRQIHRDRCMTGNTRHWGRGMGSYFFTGTELLFEMMKKIWKRILPMAVQHSKHTGTTELHTSNAWFWYVNDILILKSKINLF